MILNRTLVDGKVVFKEISFDDAVDLEDKTGLIFTDEDEKDEFYDYLDELDAMEDEDYDDEDDEDYDDEVYEAKDEEEYKESFAKKLEEKLNKLSKKLNDKLNKEEIKDTFASFADIFKDNSFNSSSKANKIVKMLPYMDEEDIHEVVLKIIDEENEYKYINLAAVLPFLSTDDCDLLFIYALEKKKRNRKLKLMAPFVSEKCLSKFVDEYVKGKYQYVDIDALYPFMASSDIKKVFKYVISKEKSE